MNHWSVKLVEELLVRYERSKHYTAPGKSSKPVSLPVTRTTLPDYFRDDSADHRRSIDAACRDLAARGLVRLQWAPLAAGQVIRRIDLALDAVAAAYAFCGRRPRPALETQMAATARAWEERWAKYPWLQAFAASIGTSALKRERLPAGFVVAENGLLDEVCRVLDALVRLQGEVPERVFSLQVLGSSKRFDQLRSRVVRVLREFFPGEADAVGQRGLLAEFGLVAVPEHIRLAGPLALATPRGNIDVAAFLPDAGLPVDTLDTARILALDAKRVVTVENLTSYVTLVGTQPPETLVVYLGGFPSQRRLRLLLRLQEYRSGLAFYHWGDIDLGGFQIFQHLRSACGEGLQPLWMDAATLVANAHAAQPFTPAYGTKLARLLEDPAYAPFHAVISLMLERCLRLEQEAIWPRAGWWEGLAHPGGNAPA